jgi:hypothetical protein
VIIKEVIFKYNYYNIKLYNKFSDQFSYIDIIYMGTTSGYVGYFDYATLLGLKGFQAHENIITN